MKQLQQVLVSVIIVNWNAGKLLQECLDSLPASLKFCTGAAEVIVVDNASSDGSVKALISPGVRLRVIENSVNRGFGAACNQGAGVAQGEYLLFLNPDTVLENDSISGALHAMDPSLYGKVGVCGIQLRDELGRISRSCTRLPTATMFVAQSIALDRIFPAVSHFMHEWDHSATRTVDHVIGAFYLIRRELFVLLKGFDERYFVYLEDLDLSARVKSSGYKSIFVTEVSAFHKGGGTSSQIKATRLFYSLRSRIQYAFKHFSISGSWCVLVATLFIEPFTRLVHCAFRGSWVDAKNTLEGFGLLFRSLPVVLLSDRRGH